MPPLPSEMSSNGNAIEIQFSVEPGIYRCDLLSKDGAFPKEKLYIQCQFRSFQDGNTPDDPDAPLTGPWDYINDDFVVPTAPVYLDGKALGLCWFDLPGIDDLAMDRARGSIGFCISEAGMHTLRWEFDKDSKGLQADSFHPAILRPDERAPSEPLVLSDEMRNCHPRMLQLPDELTVLQTRIKGTHAEQWESYGESLKELEATLDDAPKWSPHEGLHRHSEGAFGHALRYLIAGDDDDREAALRYAEWVIALPRWGTGEPGHMGCDNDIAAASTLYSLCCTLDCLRASGNNPRLDAIKNKCIEQAHRLFDFFVLQRDYLPTGYFQNHSTAVTMGLVAAGIALQDDDPMAATWLAWGRRSLQGWGEIAANDGGGIPLDLTYGLFFAMRAFEMLRRVTGESPYEHPFMKNVCSYCRDHGIGQYGISQALLAQRLNDPELQAWVDQIREEIGIVGAYGLLWLHIDPSPSNPPPALSKFRAYDDTGTAVFRNGSGKDELVSQCTWGPPVPYSVFEKTPRYNLSHAKPEAGHFSIAIDEIPVITHGGTSYKKETAHGNCVVFDDQGQWGNGFVWMPQLSADRVAQEAKWTESELTAEGEIDLTACYPPSAQPAAYHRRFHFDKQSGSIQLTDRVERGARSKATWRFHTMGSIDILPSGAVRFCNEGKSIILSIQSPVHVDLDIQQTDIVVQYRFDGNYARHLSVQAELPAEGMEIVFSMDRELNDE
ncbi:MAG: heparinase II/III-family protein [Lentisphaeria bacterium]|nr:heparinase II/III-family protein [Lentisphaeria bacterium]